MEAILNDLSLDQVAFLPLVKIQELVLQKAKCFWLAVYSPVYLPINLLNVRIKTKAVISMKTRLNLWNTLKED